MKKVIMLLFLALFTITGSVLAEELSVPPVEQQAQVPPKVQTGRITVKVFNLRSANGDLVVALFNSKKGFPGKLEAAVRKTVVSAEGAQHEVVFNDVPYGTWAVTVQHDENRNGKLDSNFLGMPKEGVGTSNNPRSRFGPPSFDSASFPVDKGDTELVINLRYL
ncbi:MAG: DUF2141 domain-containing protein [Chlorobiaceae bacterium]|nr:DUF2141 domain-containing protein [Chlorobiaceae bacterium]